MINYNPPSTANWHQTGYFDETYARAYEEGFDAAHANKVLDDNPYKPSGHERDHTYMDELNYWWYKGWCDYE